jgi:hypothetical protein
LTTPNPLLTRTTSGLLINEKGCLVADEKTGLASKALVFAGGDAVTGAATVILAAGAQARRRSHTRRAGGANLILCAGPAGPRFSLLGRQRRCEPSDDQNAGDGQRPLSNQTGDPICHRN